MAGPKSSGLHLAGQRAEAPAGAQDSETIPPEELLQYVADRLNQEAEAAVRISSQRNIRSLPGDRERNIAITHLQTAQLWLRESRARESGQ